MRNRKTFLSVLALTVVASSMLAGCTGTSNTQQKTKTDSKAIAPKKLTFWRVGTDQAEGDVWKSYIKKYEASHPGVTIDFAEVPFGTEMETKLNAAFAGGTAPDVVSYTLASLAQRASLGQYEPIDAYVKDWAGKADMLENVVNLGTFKDKLYGLGFAPAPRVFMWRKDFFQEAGLDPQKPPKSWDELAQYAAKLTKKDGNTTVRAGLDIPFSNAWVNWQIYVMQNGGRVLDLQKNEPLFASKEAIEATTYLSDMAKKGYSIPYDGNKSQDNLFSNGKAAMAYFNPSALVTLAKTDPDIKNKVGVMASVPAKTAVTFAGINFLFMSSSSKNKELAADFMMSALSKEETWNRYEKLQTPIVLNSLKEDYLKADPIINPAVFEAVQIGQGAVKATYAQRMYEIISQAIEKSFYGKQSPEEALKEAEKTFKQELPNLTK